MPKGFHDVRGTKKMLAHGCRKGMGPFHGKLKRTPDLAGKPEKAQRPDNRAEHDGQ